MDYGLGTSIVNGLKEGLIGYQTMRNIRNQEDQMRRQQETQGLLQGVQQNAQTGKMEYTPAKIAEINFNKNKMEAQQRELDLSKAMEDPNSPETQNMLANYKQIYGTQLAPGTTGKTAQGLLSASGNVYKADTLRDIADLRNQLGMYKATHPQESPTAGIRSDTITAKARKDFLNDPDLRTATNAGRSLTTDLKMMEGNNVPLKTLNEVALNVANVLSGKGAATDFKLKQMEVNNFQTQLADLRSKVLSNPEEPAPPEVLKFWKDMATRINGNIDQRVENLANRYATGIEQTYKHTPQAVDTIKALVKSHQKGGWRNLDESGNVIEEPAIQGAPPSSPGGLLPSPGAINTLPQKGTETKGLIKPNYSSSAMGGRKYLWEL